MKRDSGEMPTAFLKTETYKLMVSSTGQWSDPKTSV